MKFLLDTNVLSETIKPAANKNVIKWLNSIAEESKYISVLTIGEISKGIEKLGIDSKQRVKLTLWLENDLSKLFDRRILPIDSIVAEKWGYITARSSKTLPVIDSLLAATALVHNLVIVTRNFSDFKSIPGLEVYNPWE